MLRGLGAALLVVLLAGCGASGRAHGSGPQPAGTAVAASPSPSRSVPAGVSRRNDCAAVPTTTEANCQPRIPTAPPPGGPAAWNSLPPATVANLLCSGIADDVVQQILGGPFRAYTNPKGECHFDKEYTDHAAQLGVLIARTSFDGFRSDPAVTWHTLDVGGLPAGYIDVTPQDRWYYIALTGDPGARPLYVYGRYTKFKGPNSAQTVPAPPEFLAATDGYVHTLVAYLTA
jgi:hypothetical protein